MTRKEAKEILLQSKMQCEYPHGAYGVALDMAIKALEREPCDDCISRQAALSKIKEVCFSEEWAQFRANNGSNGQRDFLINYIEQLSPVTPQPKIGHWIYHRNSCGTECRECSNCMIWFSWDMPRNSYCPNCGAKMESEE